MADAISRCQIRQPQCSSESGTLASQASMRQFRRSQPSLNDIDSHGGKLLSDNWHPSTFAALSAKIRVQAVSERACTGRFSYVSESGF